MGTGDDDLFDGESKETRVGRTRRPTAAERASSETLFRADSVLALTEALPADVSAVESHVAGTIDGFRPVARLRKKSGLSSEDLRVALGMLHTRGLLELVGVVEQAFIPWGTDRAEYPTDATVPKGAGDVIPPHVMDEIQSMIDEEERKRADEEGAADAFDDEITTETALPDDADP